MTLRTCKFSGVQFVPRRRNQIFATPSARVAYHNLRYQAVRDKIHSINKQLLRNYRILIQELGQQSEVIRNKHYLKGRGFNFSTFTSLERFENKYSGQVYDLYIKEIESDNYKIFKK